MNRITSQYVLFGCVLLLLATNIARTGWIAGLLPLLAPFAWLWVFALDRKELAVHVALNKYSETPRSTSPALNTIALCMSASWLIAPVFVFMGEWLNYFFATIASGDSLTYFVLRAGLTEELLKFSAVLLVIKYLAPGAIKHPADGIILACASAMGFAAYENIFHNLHLFEMDSGAIKAYMLGAFIRVPLHALYSALWGAALGIATFTRGPHRYMVLTAGLFAAIFTHGLWDTLAQSNSGWIFAMMIVLYGFFWYGYLLLRYKVATIEMTTSTTSGDNHE
ncbi:MAG: PrsW family intramembrane metalloprotease [Cyanobacteria bacterium SZAS TMP-1]|nr:PrsW family intramembrane metalloprotease [Cyanobacteria bacterium SZAS TMP-1]